MMSGLSLTCVLFRLHVRVLLHCTADVKSITDAERLDSRYDSSLGS